VPFFSIPPFPKLKLCDAGSGGASSRLPTEDRSHFISQDKMDRGVADGERPLKGGWLARHSWA